MGIGLVLRGRQPSVGTGETGRASEQAAVMVEAGWPLVFVGWVAIQDTIMTNEATLDFIEPDLASELGVMPGFATLNDGRVRLEQADQLQVRREFFALKDPAHGLADHVLNTR